MPPNRPPVSDEELMMAYAMQLDASPFGYSANAYGSGPGYLDERSNPYARFGNRRDMLGDIIGLSGVQPWSLTNRMQAPEDPGFAPVLSNDVAGVYGSNPVIGPLLERVMSGEMDPFAATRAAQLAVEQDPSLANMLPQTTPQGLGASPEPDWQAVTGVLASAGTAQQEMGRQQAGYDQQRRAFDEYNYDMTELERMGSPDIDTYVRDYVAQMGFGGPRPGRRQPGDSRGGRILDRWMGMAENLPEEDFPGFDGSNTTAFIRGLAPMAQFGSGVGILGGMLSGFRGQSGGGGEDDSPQVSAQGAPMVNTVGANQNDPSLLQQFYNGPGVDPYSPDAMAPMQAYRPAPPGQFQGGTAWGAGGLVDRLVGLGERATQRVAEDVDAVSTSFDRRERTRPVFEIMGRRSYDRAASQIVPSQRSIDDNNQLAWAYAALFGEAPPAELTWQPTRHYGQEALANRPTQSDRRQSTAANRPVRRPGSRSNRK